MSTLKTNNVQIGQSGTATNNFVLSVPASPDGTIKLARGNQGATTDDILSVSSSGGVAYRMQTSVISTNTNAVSGVNYIATASLTLTLPSSPSAGTRVGFQNSSGTTTCVIARNGSNIMSLAEDMTVNQLNHAFVLQYVDATRGWVFA